MAKILIVDDERVLVKGIKFNLEHEGYQVQDAYDGEEAVELAREGGFDLIILDVMMPKIDGLQACMRIREFSNVPIIMLTAKGEDPGRVYSRENLLNVVWGYEYIGDFRTVDVHIRRLREKLELDPANPEYIRTKWGVGYYLSARGPRRLENV